MLSFLLQYVGFLELAPIVAFFQGTPLKMTLYTDTDACPLTHKQYKCAALAGKYSYGFEILLPEMAKKNTNTERYLPIIPKSCLYQEFAAG